MLKQIEYCLGRIYTVSPKGYFGLIKCKDNKVIPYLSNKRYKLGKKVWFHVVEYHFDHENYDPVNLCIAVDLTRKKPAWYDKTIDCEHGEPLDHIGKHGKVLDQEPDFNNFKTLREENTNNIFAFQGLIPKDTKVGFIEDGDTYQGDPTAVIIHL